MQTRGLHFTTARPVSVSAPGRMDIALFVGFVSRRDNPVPDHISNWLSSQNYSNDDDLLDVPVPIEEWDEFDYLFSWDERTATFDDQLETSITMDTYLGSCVYSFFRQGGRKCYVVRVEDHFEYQLNRAERLQKLERLIPGYNLTKQSSSSDRSSWFGAGHLYGLPDVSILSLPDLPELISAEYQPPSITPPEGPVVEEKFVECSEPVFIDVDDLSQYLRVPRSDDEAYLEWAGVVRLCMRLLTDPASGRMTQLVAAIPVPFEGDDADKDLINYFQQRKWLMGNHDNNPDSIASAFVQLVYPWLSITNRNLPEDAENPEGGFAGLLARNALTRGSFHSLNDLPVLGVDDLFLPLSQQQIVKEYDETSEYLMSTYRLMDRVSLFDYTKQGIRLISDVTNSSDLSYRPANIARIVSLIVRESRRLGQELIFESSGEHLWGQLRSRMEEFLYGLYLVGGLRGKTAEQAYQVKCDRTTMTQNDIDNGRMIAAVMFVPAASIESMVITLALDGNGQVSLQAINRQEAA